MTRLRDSDPYQAIIAACERSTTWLRQQIKAHGATPVAVLVPTFDDGIDGAIKRHLRVNRALVQQFDSLTKGATR